MNTDKERNIKENKRDEFYSVSKRNLGLKNEVWGMLKCRLIIRGCF